MEKLNLAKLIANDIVNYGMDKTMGFNYIVSLNDFLDEYDEDTCNYIKSHINEIIDDVEANENVADLEYDEKRQEFNMVFYYDELLNSMEKTILNTANNLGYEFEIDELREMSYEIENSNEYKNLINNIILNNSKDKGVEL
jgi:hypothetical protein